MLRTARRAGAVAAAVTALAVAGTSSAWAHHCYKEDWNEAAYAHLSDGRTPWLPLSDLAAFVIAEEIGLPQCAGYGDQVAAAWMEATGAEAEPLIHLRATVGGGALYHRGFEPVPFGYLGDADFEVLDAALGEALEDCLGGAA